MSPICTGYRYAISVTLCVVLALCITKSRAAPVVLEQDLIRVEAPAAHERYAKSVLAHATAALRTLNDRTGDALLVPVTFVVAATEQRFLELAGGEGEHALAVADGEDRLVIISLPAMARSASDRIQQVLVHELAHVYLEVKTSAPVPRWLHEGVAQAVAGEWPDAPGAGRMAIASYTGGLIPLEDLVATFPRDITRRNQAYAQALSVTRFIIDEDHGNSLPNFLKSIRGDKGAEYLKSLRATVHLRAIELRWHDALKSPVFALTVLVSSGFFWGIAALLAIVAYVVKRRRSKVIRAQWAAEEDTWMDGDSYGDPGYADTDDPDEIYHEGDGEEWKR